MTIFELEARDQEQLEKDYRDWCQKYDVNYIVEHEVDLEDLANQKNLNG